MAFDLPVEGIYRGKITKWGLESAKTGNPQWVFSAVLTEIASDPENLTADGWQTLNRPLNRKVFNPITPKTVDRVLDEVKSLGVKVDSPLDLDPRLGKNPADFQNVQVVLSCEHEEWPEGSGKINAKFRISRRRGGKPLTADEQETLAALYGDTFRDRMEDFDPTGKVSF